MRLPAPLDPQEVPQMQIIAPEKIRIYRDARRISLRQLARACDCTHTAIANYENGRTPTIPEDRAKMISLICGFPLASVFRPDDAFVMPGVESSAGTDAA